MLYQPGRAVSPGRPALSPSTTLDSGGAEPAKGPRSRLPGFLRAHHWALNVVALAVYAWLIVCVVSYGITQSTSVNAYGIQPGTPLPIAAAITPAASIWYLAQYVTYGSVHVCGTFTHPCAWPKTWPGPDYRQNVNAFDDIWFAFFGLAFVTFLMASRSALRSVRALSVPPILLGAILYFDDNYWFYRGFSDELNQRGVSWLTNENVMLVGVGCFAVSTAVLWWRRGAHRAVPGDRTSPD